MANKTPRIRDAVKAQSSLATKKLALFCLDLGLWGLAGWLFISAGDAALEAGARRALKDLSKAGINLIHLTGETPSKLNRKEMVSEIKEAKKIIYKFGSNFEKKWPGSKRKVPWAKAAAGAGTFAAWKINKRKRQKKPQRKLK